MKRQSIILCEGFHDRAFWQGWLLAQNFKDPGVRPGSARAPVQDPWGRTVARGQFAFIAPSGHFVRVVPCGGRPKMLPEARLCLKQRAINPLVCLVLNVDTDEDVEGPTSGAQFLGDLFKFARSEDETAALAGPGAITMDQGKTTISSVRWTVDDPATRGTPNQQTLERLVCCSLASAFPQRADSVQSWLDSRPDAPPAGVKEYAWSYMAGWNAEHGCEQFFAGLWRIPEVAQELEKRLRASGAWEIVETLSALTDETDENA